MAQYIHHLANESEADGALVLPDSTSPNPPAPLLSVHICWCSTARVLKTTQTMKKKQVETRNWGLGIEMIGTSCTDQPVSEENRLTFLVFILQGYWLLNSQAPIQASTKSDNQARGVLPRILDRGVQRRFVNPNPIQGLRKRKLIPFLRPKAEKRRPIQGKNKIVNNMKRKTMFLPCNIGCIASSIKY